MDLLYNNILDTFSNLILHTFSPAFPVCGHGPRDGWILVVFPIPIAKDDIISQKRL